ncbi:hypothetical protein OTU49_003449, partial [Cherax quadricarinatus]
CDRGLASPPPPPRHSGTTSNSSNGGSVSSGKQTVVWSPADGRTTTTTTTTTTAPTSASPVITTTTTTTTAMSRKFSCSPKAIKELIHANLLPILTVSGVTGGAVLGLILRYSREEHWTKREVMYVGYIGELFLRALKALIIPLIVSSLVSAIGSLDLSLSKKIGLRAIAYYMTTTVLAVILGIILVVSIHPGKGSDEGIKKAGEARDVYTPDLLMDLLRNLFPPNLIQACFETHKTIIIQPKLKDLENDTLPPKAEWELGTEHTRALNIMGLVSFATLLGLALSTLGAKGKPLLDFFHSLSDASM